ncbi:hypothetical protein GPN2_12516 [Streptomyces murinus]
MFPRAGRSDRLSLCRTAGKKRCSRTPLNPREWLVSLRESVPPPRGGPLTRGGDPCGVRHVVPARSRVVPARPLPGDRRVPPSGR